MDEEQFKKLEGKLSLYKIILFGLDIFYSDYKDKFDWGTEGRARIGAIPNLQNTMASLIDELQKKVDKIKSLKSIPTEELLKELERRNPSLKK